MTQEQDIAWFVELREAPEQVALRFLIEIDHDVTAEDHIDGPRMGSSCIRLSWLK